MLEDEQCHPYTGIWAHALTNITNHIITMPRNTGTEQPVQQGTETLLLLLLRVAAIAVHCTVQQLAQQRYCRRKKRAQRPTLLPRAFRLCQG